MDRDEAKKLLIAVYTAFPAYKPENKTFAVDLWQRMLADVPYHLADKALQLYIMGDTKGFPPSIGQIVESAKRIQLEQQKSEDRPKAWMMKYIGKRDKAIGIPQSNEKPCFSALSQE